MTTLDTPPTYDWIDFEPEPNVTGDGSGDPDKHILTIRDPHGEEYAVIVHRTIGGKYPVDGALAEAKRAQAAHIVEALNALPATPADELAYILTIQVPGNHPDAADVVKAALPGTHVFDQRLVVGRQSDVRQPPLSFQEAQARVGESGEFSRLVLVEKSEYARWSAGDVLAQRVHHRALAFGDGAEADVEVVGVSEEFLVVCYLVDASGWGRNEPA